MYFSFAQDFVAGVISLEKLSEAMRLGKLGEQIVLKSPKAFVQIEFVACENVDADIYYTRKIERERDARREYRKRKREKADIHELYIIDIMREEMTNGDVRLSRCLSFIGTAYSRRLAELSGVPLRQIQLFEQRQRDINKTKAIDVVRLCRVLCCKTEDLLQI